MSPLPFSARPAVALAICWSIGIAHAMPLMVTTTADELDPIGTPGSGLSLREALRDVPSGETILFDPAVFSSAAVAKITLNAALGDLIPPQNSTIDASPLPYNVTIDGGTGTNRIFQIAAGRTFNLLNLTLTGGNGTGTVSPGNGGAIFNFGTLSLTNCRIEGNSASNYGGAILSYSIFGASTVTLTRCTLSNNTSSNHAPCIFNWAQGATATLVIDSCTLSGNSGSQQSVTAGALYNYSAGGLASATIRRSTITGNSTRHAAAVLNYSNASSGNATLSLERCTVSGNLAHPTDGFGGACWNIVGSGTASISTKDSIIAANSAAFYEDIFLQHGTITSQGGNLIGEADVFTMTPGPGDQLGDINNLINPQLAPLGDYGGPTQTMALGPTSPARNAGQTGGLSLDQRGAMMVGLPDCGAYESGNPTNFAAYIYELLPLTANHLASADADADAATNEAEYLALTNPADPSSILRPQATQLGNSIVISFPTSAGRNYTLEESETLLPGSWTASQTVAGNGNLKLFTIPMISGVRQFFRVQPSL